MEDFPGNTHSARDYGNAKDKKERPEKNIVQVTASGAKKRKKSLGKKIGETFTADDTQSVGQHIIFEVLIPAAKSMVLEAVSQGFERLLYGDSQRPTRGPQRGNYVAYNRTSVRGSAQTDGRRSMSHRAKANHDFDEVILETRGEVEEVLERLSDLIRDYDHATVSDMYELVGVTGSFQDEKWGWTNLRGAGFRRIRDGYLLDLPRPVPID